MLSLFKLVRSSTVERSLAGSVGYTNPRGYGSKRGLFNSKCISLLPKHCFATSEQQEQVETKKSQIEEEIDNFDINWDEMEGNKLFQSREFQEDLEEQISASFSNNEEASVFYDRYFKERYGPNFNRLRTALYREHPPGFHSSFNPLPRKLNFFDKSNSADISTKLDYVAPSSKFDQILSKLTYLDHKNRSFFGYMHSYYQTAIHYGEAYPDMKMEVSPKAP